MRKIPKLPPGVGTSGKQTAWQSRCELEDRNSLRARAVAGGSDQSFARRGMAGAVLGLGLQPGSGGRAWKERGQPRHIAFWLQAASPATPSCQCMKMNPRETCFEQFVTRHFLRLLSCLITLQLA